MFVCKGRGFELYEYPLMFKYKYCLKLESSFVPHCKKATQDKPDGKD